jgi:hypothetical protein
MSRKKEMVPEKLGKRREQKRKQLPGVLTTRD